MPAEMWNAQLYLPQYTSWHLHTEDPEYLSNRDDAERSSNSDLSGIDFIGKQSDSRAKSKEGRHGATFRRCRLFLLELLGYRYSDSRK